MNIVNMNTAEADIPKGRLDTEAVLQMSIDQGIYKKPKEIVYKAVARTMGIQTAMKRVKEINKMAISVFESMSPDVLIDYILNIHHRFTKENAVIIYDQVQKVVYLHGKDYPDLAEFHTAFFFFFHDLLNHEKKEEEVLFVNIRKMFNKEGKKALGIDSNFGLLFETVKIMEHEHIITCKRLIMLRKLSKRYLALVESCNSCKYLFDKMNEFENDLLMHIYLESHILFPKAISKEQELMKQD